MSSPLSPDGQPASFPRTLPSTTPRPWVSSSPSPTNSVYSAKGRTKQSTPSLRSVGSATTSSSDSPSTAAPWTPPLLPANFTELIHIATSSRAGSSSPMSETAPSLSAGSEGTRQRDTPAKSPARSKGGRRRSHEADRQRTSSQHEHRQEVDRCQAGSDEHDIEGPSTPSSSLAGQSSSRRLPSAASYRSSSTSCSPGSAPSPASYFPSSPRPHHLSPTVPGTPTSIPFPSSPRSPSSPSPSLLAPSQTSSSLHRPRRSSKRLLSASPTVETLGPSRFQQQQDFSTPPRTSTPSSPSIATPRSARSNRSMSSASSVASFRTALEDPAPPLPAFPPWTPPFQHGSPTLSPSSGYDRGRMRDSMVSRQSSYYDPQEFMDDHDEGHASDDEPDHDGRHPFASSASAYESPQRHSQYSTHSASTSTSTLYPPSTTPSRIRSSQAISSPPQTPKASSSTVPPVPALPSFASAILSPSDRSALLHANSYFLPPICRRPSELELAKLSDESSRRARPQMKPSASTRAKGMLRGAKSVGNLNASASRQTLQAHEAALADGKGRGRTLSSGPSGGIGTFGSRASGLASWFIGGQNEKGKTRVAIPKWEDGASVEPAEDDLGTTLRKERKRDLRERSVRLENLVPSQYAPEKPVELLPTSRTTGGLNISQSRPLDLFTASPSVHFPPLVLQRPAHRRKTSIEKVEKHKQLWREDLLTQAIGFSLTLSPPLDAGADGGGSFLPSPPLAPSSPKRERKLSAMKKSISGKILTSPPPRTAADQGGSMGARPPLPTTPEIHDRRALPTMRKSLQVPLHSDELQYSDDSRTSSVYSISWNHSTSPPPAELSHLLNPASPSSPRLSSSLGAQTLAIPRSTSSELPYYTSPPGDFDPSGFEQPIEADSRYSVATNFSLQDPVEVLISEQSSSSVASEYSAQDYATDSENGMLGIPGMVAGIGLGLEMRGVSPDRGTLGQRSRENSWKGSVIAEETEESGTGGEESDSSQSTQVKGPTRFSTSPLRSVGNKQPRRPPALNINPWGTSPNGAHHHLPILAASPTSLYPSSPIASSADLSEPYDKRRSFLGDLSVLPSPSHPHHPGDAHLLRSPPLSPYALLSPTPRSTSQSGSLSPQLSVYSLPRSPYLRQRAPIPGALSNPDLPLAGGTHSSPYLASSNVEASSSLPSKSQTNLSSRASTASFFDNLDPTLPITNTLPPLPRSASASIKLFFSRSPKPHQNPPRPPPPPPSVSVPRLPRSKSKTGTFVPIPASAFDAAPPPPPLVPTLAPPQAGGKSGPGARIEAWRNAQQSAADPGVTRLEGMLEMHVELERERIRKIGVVASAGGGVGEAPSPRRGR